MKKISLKKLNIREVEKLSREQLKNVLGGWTGSTGETGNSEDNLTNHSCNCSNGKICSVSPHNSPTPEQVAAACAKCCAA